MSIPRPGKIQMIPVDKVEVLNPRERNGRVFEEIVGNIKTIGLKKPITVTPRKGTDGEERYLLVCGEGRLKAFKSLGEATIPALVIEVNDEDAFIMSLAENIARRQNRPLELLAGVEALRDKGYDKKVIAPKTGLTVEYVNGILTLLQHGEERLLVAVQKGRIPLNAALAIVGAGDDDKAVQAALHDAYASGKLRGKHLLAARRVIERRQTLGRSVARGMPRKRSDVTTSSLVRTYQREVDRQRLMVKKAEFSQQRLFFVVGALRQLLTMQSWMFLSSYEKLRTNLLNEKTLTSMAHLGPRAFDSIGGEVVSTTAFVLENTLRLGQKGDYLRLVDGLSEADKDRMLREAVRNRDCGWYHRAASTDFQRIPGTPIAYWIGPAFSRLFEYGMSLAEIAPAKIGMRTGNNETFLRRWFEVSFNKTGLGFQDAKNAEESKKKWFPYNKGGELRRWYGNNEYVVNWESDGDEIKTETLANYPQLTRDNLGWKISNESFYFRPCVTWSFVSSSNFGVRQSPSGFLFDVGGSCAFPNREQLDFVTGYLCSSLAFNAMKFMNPTLNFQISNVAALPLLAAESKQIAPAVSKLTQRAVEISKGDWNFMEISWDFANLPILPVCHEYSELRGAYAKLRVHWHALTSELQRLEEENNRIFIDAYGLQDELKPDVPLSEITLTCNPHYRYGGDKSAQELEDLLRADTMREFISYAVGCMFGRYSLEQPGLILASQSETLAAYLRRVPQPRFMPDENNVIPLLDGDWFSDDVTGRFREFLRITFSDEHYDESLRFIEEALGKKGKPLAIRDYFLRDFYTDHVKRYKKRPIYWLFSSPKGMDNQLFVSKYQLELPKREEIERFLAEKLREAGVADE